MFSLAMFVGLASAEIVQIKAIHGKCLDAHRRCVTGAEVHMWDCDGNQKNQMWNYDPSTGLIESVFGHGRCLDGGADDRNKRGGEVHMHPCDENNYNQQWKYDANTGQIKLIHGICLDASERNQRGGNVHMWDCDTNNQNQQWTMTTLHAGGATCGGTAGGAPCTFPFTYEGTTYDACTTVDNNGQPWCYTVNEGKWGNCECSESVIVHVGPSNGDDNSKTVDVNVSECPEVVDKTNWLGDAQHADTFAVTWTVGTVTVRRTDSNVGWGMDLSFKCTAQPRPPTRADGFQGCYENIHAARVDGHEDDMNFEQCRQLAYSQGKKFFGLENPGGFPRPGHAECLVLDSAGQYLQMARKPDADCEVEGLHKGLRLGGGNRLAVYEIPDQLHNSNPVRLRYNQVRQKSSHNSYERSEALIDQIQYHRIHSLELDIWRDKGGSETKPGQWFVYHNPQTKTTCHRLQDCLQEFKAFHDANPQHEVITVWMDLKNSDMHHPWARADMDRRLFSSGLPIYRPRDLKGSEANLRAGVAKNGWPMLSDLRGKFIFVMTDNVHTYCHTDDDCNEAAAFRHCSLTNDPSEIHSHGQFCVFYNQGCTGRSGDNLRHIEEAGYVSRCFRGDDVDSAGEWRDAVYKRAHHIATNQVNIHEDPEIKSHNWVGWPFEAMDDGTDTRCVLPKTNVIGLSIDSGDIWNKHDDFMFAYMREHEENKWHEYTVMVNNVNSHVEDWAKAGIMIRREIDSKNRGESSPYMAVIRGADAKKLRAQWRNGHAHDSHERTVDIAPYGRSIDQESRCFLQLWVYLTSDHTEVEAYGSQDGVNWQQIYKSGFDGKFTYVGLAGSSHDDNNNHDGTKVKHLFTNFKKDGRLIKAGDLERLSVGNDVPHQRLYDGIFDQHDI